MGKEFRKILFEAETENEQKLAIKILKTFFNEFFIVGNMRVNIYHDVYIHKNDAEEALEKLKEFNPSIKLGLYNIPTRNK